MEDIRRATGDDGQLLPLVALIIAGVALAAFGLVRLAAVAVDKAEASSAADAAALAAAGTAGRDVGAEARGLATRNGATVLRAERLPGGDVRVAVERHGAVATARARRDGGGSGTIARSGRGLAPAMQAALARAAQLLGRPVPVTSGYRSPVDQARLWAVRGANRFPVAPPGTSMHERGLAVDVPASFAASFATTARAAGLCRPYPVSDPVHFELCGRRFTPSDGG